MVTLRRDQKIRYKLYRPKGQYSAIKISKRNGFDPFYSDLKRYVCQKCGEIKYYISISDVDSPQYALKGKVRIYCHDCWHTYRPNSPCRFCKLRAASKASARKFKIQSKLAAAGEVSFDNTEKISWVPATREQVRVRRNTGLSTGRRSNKNKKDRGSGRRRSSRVS